MQEKKVKCQECGAEYSISEPGNYQCQQCKNVFEVKDVEQESSTLIQFSSRTRSNQQNQIDKLKEIKEKAKNQQEKQKEFDDYMARITEQEKKKKEVVSAKKSQEDKSKKKENKNEEQTAEYSMENKFYGNSTSTFLFYLIVIEGISAFISLLVIISKGASDGAREVSGVALTGSLTLMLILWIVRSFYHIAQRVELYLRMIVKSLPQENRKDK